MPFFILAGNLMGAGGISTRLVDFAEAVVGGVQGGLACTCILTCTIFAVVSGSSVATTFAIGAWIIATFHEGWSFLLAVNLFLFVIGMFIETSASIIVLAPILAPVAAGFGIDPVHFGLIMVVNLALGTITPPFGVNLFAACAVARISLDRVVPSLLPFVLVVLACLAVITYFPALSLALRDLLY